MNNRRDDDRSYREFAGIYDLLMQDVDYAGWAAYLFMLLQSFAPSAKSIADCACGTGAFSIRFAQAGYQTTGLDISAEMLQQAQEKARLAEVRIPFVRQDMCALELHRPVDIINCACDGVNYLYEDAKAASFFRAAYGALRPGGVLLFDISSAYKLSNILGGNVFTETEQEFAYIWSNQFDPNTRLVEMELTCFRLCEDARYARFDEWHTQRAYTQEELTGLLQTAGFFEIEVYEAFTRNAPRKESERLQFVAKKP